MLIPLKVDVPMYRTPWANYAIMALVIVVSIAGFVDTDFFWSLAGAEATVRSTAYGGAQVELTLTNRLLALPMFALTSSMLHVGILHLAGNMLFLWVFGNAVNYKFGQLGYLVLYLVVTVWAGMTHYLHEGFPAVGASGAVSGMMGAFLVFFPRNDVTVFWIIWIRPGLSRISSGWIIMLWVVWDVVCLALGWNAGVALWAHLGGFTVGFAVAVMCSLAGWIKPTQDEQTLLQVLQPGR